MGTGVISLSGGIDSVCWLAIQSQSHDVHAVVFDYGQRADSVEKRVARKFADEYAESITVVTVPDLWNSNSNMLTNSDTSVKIPSDFINDIVVPYRNGVFVSMCVAIAGQIGKCEFVTFGSHLDDYNYPDCSPGFVKPLTDAARVGLNDTNFEIFSAASRGFNKSQLIRLGYGILGNKIFDTFSCYEYGTVHCGVCESCVNRQKAFKRASIADKTEYFERIPAEN